MNTVQLVGNLTRDCTCRQTSRGTVTTFTVACDSRTPDGRGGYRDSADYIHCYMWGDRGAKLAPYLTKGKQVGITGQLKSSSWDDKDTGKRLYSLSVKVNEFEFVGGPGKSVSTEQANADRSQAQSRDPAPRAVPEVMKTFGVQPVEVGDAEWDGFGAEDEGM